MKSTTILLLKNEDNFDAFNELYRSWSGKLYHFILKISNGDTYLAEELVQEVFTIVWEKRKELDENKSFDAYICTIAKDRLINIYKHRMVEVLYAQAVNQTGTEEYNKTEDDVDYHLLDEYLNKLIDQLPPSRKNIFILSRRKHLSNKEIAAQLNLSENTIESQLSKALAFIRKGIEDHYSVIIASLFSLFIH